MTKEILWVTVGRTDKPTREDELEYVADAIKEGFDDDKYHIFVTAEDVNLFDLDTLERQVDEVRDLIENR